MHACTKYTSWLKCNYQEWVWSLDKIKEMVEKWWAGVPQSPSTQAPKAPAGYGSEPPHPEMENTISLFFLQMNIPLICIAIWFLLRSFLGSFHSPSNPTFRYKETTLAWARGWQGTETIRLRVSPTPKRWLERLGQWCQWFIYSPVIVFVRYWEQIIPVVFSTHQGDLK